MAWDFQTDPEIQVELDWIEQFVREEVELSTTCWAARGISTTRCSSNWSNRCKRR